MGLRLLIDGEDTGVDTFQYTAVDPGGFETLTVSQAARAPQPGAPATVRDGLETAWSGIVEEPGHRHERSRASANVSAVGHGAAFKRNPYSMVYIDQDPRAWTEPPFSRRLRMVATSGETLGMINATIGVNGLTWDTPSDALPAKANAELFYLAPDDAPIAKIAYRGDRTGAFTNFETPTLSASDTDDLSGTTETYALTLDDTLRTQALSATRRYLMLRARNDPGVTPGATWQQRYSRVAAYGNHGLTGQPITGEPDGLFPSEIALDAARRSRARFDVGQIELTASYLVRQLAKREPTMPEQWISEMAALLGWHWGVWEPRGVDGRPTFWFCPRPRAATSVVRYFDLETPDIAERLSGLHNQAVISYQDPVGPSGVVTVTRPHPRLPAGVDQQLVVDAGQASAASAQAYGTYLLALDQAQSRVAGQAVLPAQVLTLAGGIRPSHLLKPGRDRIQVLGLPTTAPVLADQAEMIDTFRIKRLTVNVQNGVPRTTVEFDTGADLTETLQARTTAAVHLAGF